MIYNLLILGSGRSGTSMITGCLAKSGYNLGENASYLGENAANPKGFFEDLEVNTINEDILALHILNLPEKVRKIFCPSHTFYRARWLARIDNAKTINKSTPQINQRIKSVIAKTPFCFKDPRFSYTLPIWSQYLNEDTKFLVVFREPEKTAESIVRECRESAALSPLRMNEQIALEVWLCMYSHILGTYSKHQNKERWSFIHFNQIFDKESIDKLEIFTGAKIQSGFAEKAISRTKETGTVSSKKELKSIYKQLCDLASYSPL